MDALADHVSCRSASDSLHRHPRVGLRVALVCLVWGEEFADFFARYCLRSLLEPTNIPLVAREHDITLLLYTDRATQDFLDRSDSFNALSRFANVELLPLEHFPATARTNHWIPWQHAVAGRSGDFDAFLVIIPDCVYAAGSLGTIIDALREHDTVHYRLPQVCKETVAVELDGLLRIDGHEYISFNSLQVVELFVRHVNPKHAAAACSGRFFINHPEFDIQLSPECMTVSEPAAHALAVRSSTRGLSYTFDALSPGAKACYLEILGLSAEPALKFLEQYYRWPKLHREYSRLMNLGSWALTFRDASNAAYCKSATHITLDHGLALEQHRGQVKHAKTKFVNATLDVLAIATRVYEHARQSPDNTAARYIALAIAAPGFQRRLRQLPASLTVVLPKTGTGFEQVVQAIEDRPAAGEALRRFLFLHVVADRLPITTGHAIFLTYSGTTGQLPKAFVLDAHTVAPGAGLWGKATSPPEWVWENLFCVEAEIDYSHLTWSMLDPQNGSSEPVLAPRNGAAFTVEKVASIWTAGRRWLRIDDGHHSPLLRLAKREARWLYDIAARIYRALQRRRPAGPRHAQSILLPTESVRARYDAISKFNIVDGVAKVTLAFYERLGLSVLQSPVYRCLADMRSQLAEEVEACGGASSASSLERFEFAWRAYEAGAIRESLQQFGDVIADEPLARTSAADPRSREALVRAAEILARHAELRGQTGTAEQLHRRSLGLSGSGIVARRLVLILWRRGRIREAATFAPRVMRSETNLVQHLQGSDAVGDLTLRLRRAARPKPTTARGHNARDFGLPVG